MIPVLDTTVKKQLEKLLESETENVSRETFFRLELLVREVIRWQKAINLISRNTIKSIWARHILDSAQLLGLIRKLEPCFVKEQKIENVKTVDRPALKDRSALKQKKHENLFDLMDLGSGAGFPGLVLASMSNLKIHLIDSDQQKCQFLSQTIDKLKLTAKVSAQRIETFDAEEAPFMITARALAPLPELLKLVQPLMKDKSKALFFKGASWEKEVKTAQKKFDFNFVAEPSLTHDQGCILVIDHIRHKD